jgi:hypothetical protein
MVGKTIAATSRHDRYSDNLILHFTDGTCVLLEATGWEADGIEVTALSYAEKMRRGCKAAGEREAERVRRLAADVLLAQRAELKASMTEAAWETWLDEHEPGWRTGKLLADVYRSEIEAQIKSMSLLMNRQAYGGEAIIPIKREATSDS